MGVNDGAKGMRLRHELFMRPFAADPGKPHGSMHGTERVGIEAGFLECRTAGLFHFDKRAVDSQTQRSGAGNAGSKQASLCVLDARTATRAATINADEQRTRL
jgi:hypothetical protein